MNNFTKEEAIEQINQLGKEGKAFFFLIDYKMGQNRIIPLDGVNPEEILFDFNGIGNTHQAIPPLSELKEAIPATIEWEKWPVSFEHYQRGFELVLAGLKAGNSFLTNLTGRTPIHTNLSLKQIFAASKARYRLWVKGQFCALSPEIFVQIRNNRIASFPMKGTIDADIPDAEKEILLNPKEKAEHATIVDLIRNDLSMHASDVVVKRFRYIDRLKTNTGELLQVSSEITGLLPDHFRSFLGNMLYDMLPAGSICGAPKKKTLEIIDEAEADPRGFYTGIAGIFDGQNLDSGVLIRFIEQDENGQLYFRSGGGITAQSDAQSEYDELIQKIYVPICRNNQNL